MQEGTIQEGGRWSAGRQHLAGSGSVWRWVSFGVGWEKGGRLTSSGTMSLMASDLEESFVPDLTGPVLLIDRNGLTVTSARA